MVGFRRGGASRATRVALLALAGAFAGCSAPSEPAPATPSTGVRPGGELRVAVSAEPQSFNWYTRHDASTDVVTQLTQARLVRVNRATQDVEPWLAERWTSLIWMESVSCRC